MEKEEKKGRSNPLQQCDKDYILKHYKHANVSALARHLKRGSGAINKYLDSLGLQAYNPGPNTKKRTIKQEGVFYEHEHENWLI